MGISWVNNIYMIISLFYTVDTGIHPLLYGCKYTKIFYFDKVFNFILLKTHVDGSSIC